jgi:hypothetical protein
MQDWNQITNGGERVVKIYQDELDKEWDYFIIIHEFNKYRRTGSNYLN